MEGSYKSKKATFEYKNKTPILATKFAEQGYDL